jgi:hypothetical protein
MRRAVVAVIMGGFTFGGIGPGLGHQPAIFGVSLTAGVRPAIKNANLTTVIRPVGKTVNKTARKTVRGTPEKTIEYEGVEFRVPAGWPVYWLDKDPNQCVRYDRNAVYVGTPGPNQNCPPGLIGRADTISIGDPAASARQNASRTPLDRPAPARVDQRAPVEGKPAADPPASSTSVAPGTIFQNPDLHEFAVAMPASSPWIDATYGTDPNLVAQTLATVRQIMPQSAALGRSKHSPPSSRATDPAWPKHVAPPAGFATTWIWPSEGASGPAPQVTPAPPSPVVSATSPTPTTVPTTAPATASATAPATAPATASATAPATTPATTPAMTASQTPSQTLPSGTLAAFDTCTAPSLQTMKAWRAKYSATAIYIGGQMAACDYGNLSASWVSQAKAMGWSLMPTFVGLQAPCNSFSGKINPKQAAAQGTAAANQAITDAGTFGLGTGSPVYFDMEAYDHTKAGCRTAVLTFLDAWDRQLRAKGYVSGVYSSADAAIIDLQTTTTIAGHSLAEPQAIWFALWDNANNLTGSPYMTASVWPALARSKQYAGNRTVKVGGISLSIDADWVNGPVVRG